MSGSLRYCLLASCIVLVGANAACSANQRLRPGRDAHPVAGMDGAAVDAENQIELIAQAGAWPGDPRIADHVEAIRVRIGNYGSRPVHVRYEHFRLASPNGDSYAVLPPLPTRGNAPTSARRIVSPRFRHVSYDVAPYYGAAYAGISIHEGPFLRAAEPDARVRFRRLGNLPSSEMVDWALPEGVLRVSGFVEGFMFFERVPKGVNELELQAVLVTPRAPESKLATSVSWVAAKSEGSGKVAAAEIVARIAIPFIVE